MTPPAAPLSAPPVARQVPHQHTEHGVARPDPFHWMRDADSPELLAHLVSERGWYDTSVAHLLPFASTLRDEMVSRLSPVDLYPTGRRTRFSYYTRQRAGSDYAELLREIQAPHRVDTTDLTPPQPPGDGNSALEVVLDVNALTTDSGYLDLGLSLVSPDENLLAYSVDTTGDEVFELRFRDLRTGADLAERVPRSYYGGAWTADSSSFFYTVHDAAYRPFQLWRHRLGTPVSDDELVLTEPDQRFELDLSGSRSGDLVLVWSESNTTSEGWVIDARDPGRGPYSVGGRRDGIRYRGDHRRLPDGSSELLVVTNAEAIEFRLMSAPVPLAGDQDWRSWVEVRAERSQERLESVDCFAGGVVLSQRRGGTHVLRLLPHHDLAGPGTEVASRWTSGEVHLIGPPAYDAPAVLFRDEADLCPPVWCEADLVGGAVRDVHRSDAPGHDADRYLAERRTFPAPDGTPIPATLLRHRDTPLDGTAPALVYGYGAYEAVFEPEWDPALPSVLDRGVVFVKSHIRGGGEGGRQWYLDGKLGAKQNTFSDHIAVADGLAAQGLVDADRIATRGLSAGGLLQGVVFNQRPDRWCAVVAEVPFVDVVTTMFDDATPLTIIEREEWGDPRVREEFDWLLAYSPCDQQPAGSRPDLLVTGALHDPRVMVREPAKWVAALRASDPEWSPRCLFRAETGAGAHVGPSGQAGHLAYEAEIYAWVLDRFGLVPGDAGVTPRPAAEAADLQQEVLEVAQTLIRIDTTNGNETEAAEYLAQYLAESGVDCELVARDPARANLVARLPAEESARADSSARRGDSSRSLAFVGHLDVVPADPRDWTHPPFEAVVDHDGYLFGRGAVDMKNEVAARTVAMAELARTGFRPRADLWLLMVADEEDGEADVGMRWLLAARPDLRPDLAVNEGGGQRLQLADGRTVVTFAVGEKGTLPVRVSALGEAGHASTPTIGDNAVPRLGELLTRVGRGLPTVETSPLLEHTLSVLLGERVEDVKEGIARASRLHPTMEHWLPPLAGTTMAPTMLTGSSARNVMPARASVDLDCRILPGAQAEDVESAVRARLGSDLRYELEFPEEMVPGSVSPSSGALPDAVAAFLAASDPGALLLPVLDTGYSDSSFLRAAVGTAAYGFSPFRTTPADVLDAGYHNADERVHVDDLGLSVAFHLDLARRLLG